MPNVGITFKRYAVACRRLPSAVNHPLALGLLIWLMTSSRQLGLPNLESNYREHLPANALSIQVAPLSNALLRGMDLELLCPGSSGSYKGPKVFENVFHPCEGQLLRKCARGRGAGHLWGGAKELSIDLPAST